MVLVYFAKHESEQYLLTIACAVEIHKIFFPMKNEFDKNYFFNSVVQFVFLGVGLLLSRDLVSRKFFFQAPFFSINIYFVFRAYGFPKLEMNNVLKKLLTVANAPVAQVNILQNLLIHV